MQITDGELMSAVADELDWDPRIDSSAVRVEAVAGVVTLCGTVGSYAEKREAARDVQRIRGVLRVDDKLEVELLDEFRRVGDTDLRDAVLQALRLDGLVPSTITARAADGWVTLTGTASSQFQRAEAERVSERIPGLRGITNDIGLMPFGPSTGDVAGAIVKAMGRNARLDASNVSVASSNGTVTLRGTVGSWADHDDAVATAWNAPAVLHVVDDLVVRHEEQ